jgi:hypothetical protein
LDYGEGQLGGAIFGATEGGFGRSRVAERSEGETG